MIEEVDGESIQGKIEVLIQNNMQTTAQDLMFKTIMEHYHICTMADTKEIYAYNGSGIYESNGENKIHGEVAWAYDKYFKRDTYKEIKSRIEGITYIEREKFNNEIELLPVENGLVNLKTSSLSPHNFEKLFTFKLPIKYDVGATCPKIDKFISEVFKEEDIPLAYEIIAYSLWRDMPIHKAFMLLGEGKNGKTTYLNLIKAFLGEKNISTRTIQEIVYNNFAASSLYGKLANISDDLPSTSLKTTGKFKMLTGGGVLSYEKKHKDAGNFSNYAKLIFAANELPASEDYTYAYFRRWCIIEFPNVFDGSNCNTNIIKEITTPEELSGLLNKVITCLNELLARGSFTIGSTKDVEKEYIRRSDSIAAFISEMIVRDNAAPGIKRGEFYEIYSKFCDDYDLAAKSQREFTTNVPVVAPWIVSCRVGDDRGWRGFNVKKVETADKRTHRTVILSNLLHDACYPDEVSQKECTKSTELNQYNNDDNINKINPNQILIIIRDFGDLISEDEILSRSGCSLDVVRPILSGLNDRGLIYSPKFGFWLLSGSGQKVGE